MSFSKNFQFADIGGSGYYTTNHARVAVAGTIPFMDALTADGYIIYQVDWDQTGTGQFILGDGDATDNSDDRIILNQKGAGKGSTVYPNGYYCRLGKAFQCQFVGSTDCWIKITYKRIVG